MAYKRKSWREKLNINRKEVVEKLKKDFADMKAGQKMLIPTPKIVDACIREIPTGQQTTIFSIRKDLAAKFGAEK